MQKNKEISFKTKNNQMTHNLGKWVRNIEILLILCRVRILLILIA